MRKVVTYIFIISLSLHTSSQLFIYMSFWLNQNFIAQHLCENRDKPELNCHGTCHLKKEIKKDEQQKQQHDFSNQIVELTYIKPTLLAKIEKPVVFQTKRPIYNIQIETPHINPYISTILRPPIG